MLQKWIKQGNSKLSFNQWVSQIVLSKLFSLKYSGLNIIIIIINNLCKYDQYFRRVSSKSSEMPFQLPQVLSK